MELARGDTADLEWAVPPPTGAVSRSPGRPLTPRPLGRWREFGIADGLPPYNISAILPDHSGAVWVGTFGGGISRYDGATWTAHAVPDGGHNIASSIAQGPEGRLWFGLRNGLGQFDGQTLRLFTHEDGLPQERVGCMAEDPRGDLWFGCDQGLIARYDGRDFASWPVQEGREAMLNSMAVDSTGHLWVGSLGDGLHRFDGEKWTHITQEDGLPSNHVTTMAVDREGGLWAAFWGGGLARYDEQATPVNPMEGMEDNSAFWALEDSSGHLWLRAGSDGEAGVGRYDGTRATFFTTADGLAGNVPSTGLVDGDGRVWLAFHEGGISRYDQGKWTTFTSRDGLPEAPVISMAEDPDGRLWLGTDQGGASCYDGQTFTTFTTRDGLATDIVLSIAASRRGQLWFATARGGASRFDGRQWTTFTTQDGLIHDNVRAVAEDRAGRLWFGTLGGVSRFDGTTWTSFSTDEGLSQHLVLSIVEDHRGHLWFGTWGGGITRYDGRIMQTLFKTDGLPNNGLRYMAPTRDGDMLINTTGGAVRYRPATHPPSVRLTEITADRSYDPVERLRLPSTQKLIRFHFQGASLGTRPERLQYVYRLQGHDQDWRPSHATLAEYTDLPPGQYRFEVKAVDRDLNYSDRAAAIDTASATSPTPIPLTTRCATTRPPSTTSSIRLKLSPAKPAIATT